MPFAGSKTSVQEHAMGSDLSYTWQPSPHTADLAIAISASEKGGLFYAALAGLLGILELDASTPAEQEMTEYGLTLKSYGIESSLVDFLNECVYLMEVEDLVPVGIHELTYGDDSLRAVLLCRPVIDADRPDIGHVKAATYSDLNVELSDGMYKAKIVFDT